MTNDKSRENHSKRRGGMPLLVAIAMAVLGVLGILIVDHGSWNKPKVQTAAMAHYGTTGEAARTVGAIVGFQLAVLRRRVQRPEGGVNSHVNAARGHVDQPCPGSASRRHVTDLESPLPDVGLAGGRNAVFDASVDHEPSRVGSIPTKDDSFSLQAIRAITGRGVNLCMIPMQDRRQPELLRLTRRANQGHSGIITKIRKGSAGRVSGR